MFKILIRPIKFIFFESKPFQKCKNFSKILIFRCRYLRSQFQFPTQCKTELARKFGFFQFFHYKTVFFHGPLALDALLIPKISKRHFFQDIKNSFHGLTRMGLEPHQNFFQNFFSTNMVARGVQSFCILEGAADSLIQQ